MILTWVIIGILITLLIVLNTIKTNKEFVKFYQIWLRYNESKDVFIVMSGIEYRNKFVSHNGIVFKKSDYVYAILPFVNLSFTYKDLKALSEKEYLELCLQISKNIYDDE